MQRLAIPTQCILISKPVRAPVRYVGIYRRIPQSARHFPVFLNHSLPTTLAASKQSSQGNVCFVFSNTDLRCQRNASPVPWPPESPRRSPRAPRWQRLRRLHRNPLVRSRGWPNPAPPEPDCRPPVWIDIPASSVRRSACNEGVRR